mmetsp:Transcript_3543/g.10630  ORF Transcript_3543/g.10630 Transcript_3543/m.10630 type:complete len:362 (-) Transcript_3543:29-1114(-)
MRRSVWLPARHRAAARASPLLPARPRRRMRGERVAAAGGRGRLRHTPPRRGVRSHIAALLVRRRDRRGRGCGASGPLRPPNGSPDVLPPSPRRRGVGVGGAPRATGERAGGEQGGRVGRLCRGEGARAALPAAARRHARCGRGGSGWAGGVQGRRRGVRLGALPRGVFAGRGARRPPRAGGRASVRRRRDDGAAAAVAASARRGLAAEGGGRVAPCTLRPVPGGVSHPADPRPEARRTKGLRHGRRLRRLFGRVARTAEGGGGALRAPPLGGRVHDALQRVQRPRLRQAEQGGGGRPRRLPAKGARGDRRVLRVPLVRQALLGGTKVKQRLRALYERLRRLRPQHGVGTVTSLVDGRWFSH